MSGRSPHSSHTHVPDDASPATASAILQTSTKAGLWRTRSRAGHSRPCGVRARGHHRPLGLTPVESRGSQSHRARWPSLRRGTGPPTLDALREQRCMGRVHRMRRHPYRLANRMGGTPTPRPVAGLHGPPHHAQLLGLRGIEPHSITRNRAGRLDPAHGRRGMDRAPDARWPPARRRWPPGLDLACRTALPHAQRPRRQR